MVPSLLPLVGTNVFCLELPDQDNEKMVIVMDGVCQDEWQWQGH